MMRSNFLTTVFKNDIIFSDSREVARYILRISAELFLWFWRVLVSPESSLIRASESYQCWPSWEQSRPSLLRSASERTELWCQSHRPCPVRYVLMVKPNNPIVVALKRAFKALIHDRETTQRLRSTRMCHPACVLIQSFYCFRAKPSWHFIKHTTYKSQY